MLVKRLIISSSNVCQTDDIYIKMNMYMYVHIEVAIFGAFLKHLGFFGF